MGRGRSLNRRRTEARSKRHGRGADFAAGPRSLFVHCSAGHGAPWAKPNVAGRLAPGSTASTTASTRQHPATPGDPGVDPGVAGCSCSAFLRLPGVVTLAGCFPGVAGCICSAFLTLSGVVTLAGCFPGVAGCICSAFLRGSCPPAQARSKRHGRVPISRRALSRRYTSDLSEVELRGKARPRAGAPRWKPRKSSSKSTREHPGAGRGEAVEGRAPGASLPATLGFARGAPRPAEPRREIGAPTMTLGSCLSRRHLLPSGHACRQIPRRPLRALPPARPDFAQRGPRGAAARGRDPARPDEGGERGRRHQELLRDAPQGRPPQLDGPLGDGADPRWCSTGPGLPWGSRCSWWAGCSA